MTMVIIIRFNIWFLIRATNQTPTYKTVFVAKEDFCFTYYDGDAARDKAHMTRLERGAYDDIISAQRKRGHLSLDDIKRVLSKDFNECWASLEWILKVDSEGNYFIEWVDKSIAKMRANSKKQKEKVEKRWKKDTEDIPRYNNSKETVVPFYEYENGNEDGIGNVLVGGAGEDFEFEVSEPFSIPPELPLPAATLEAAELNQFTLTGSKNTEFLQQRWGVFVAERIHDPPERRRNFRQLSDLTTYFLNWVRNKHPNATNQRTSSGSNSAKPGTSEARVQAAKDY
jgi:hypothetical protein